MQIERKKNEIIQHWNKSNMKNINTISSKGSFGKWSSCMRMKKGRQTLYTTIRSIILILYKIIFLSLPPLELLLLGIYLFIQKDNGSH